MKKRGSPSGCSSERRRLFSSSASTVSRSASQIDLGRIETEASGEDAQACEHRLLLRVEQVEAPVERRAQRLLALGPVARAAAEELEPLPEAREQRLRRQQLDAGRGELDRERQPVEPHAELRDRRRVLVRHGEARRDGPRALEEERHRLVPRERLERRQRAPDPASASGGTGKACSAARRSGARLVDEHLARRARRRAGR